MNMEKPFFDRDLASIMIDRVSSRLIKLNEYIFKEVPSFIDTRKDIEAAWDNFMKDEIYLRLSREVEKYKKRNHPREYQSDIEKARAGGEESLCRLIAWDKAWLFIPWVKERILKAQEEGSAQFIKAIGAAVAKETGVKTVINAVDKEDRKAILDFMTAIVSVAPEKYGAENMESVIDVFHEVLFQLEFIPDTDSLMEAKEFKRYLHRHNVI